MGTLIAGLDTLTIQEPIFKDVKYYLSGDVPEKITELLSAGGAERTKYFSDFVTHVICGANAPETDLTDANDLYEIPAVTAQWVITCVRLRKLVSPKAYSPNKIQIFSSTVICISKVSVKDAKHLYALITYHGGQVKLNLDSKCTHLICGSASGKKYTVALNIPVDRLKIVTPDWVLDSIKAKIQCVAEVYHPKLLIIPIPKPILPIQNIKRTESRISAITGFDFEEGIAKNEVPTHNLSDKDIESTQALLDKLKQRMPWNHPPSSGNLVPTSCPPNTTAAASMKTSLTQQMVTQTIQKNIITNINQSTPQYSQSSQISQSQASQSPNVTGQQQVQQQQPHGLSAIQLQQQRLLQQHQLRVQMLQQQNQNKNITQQVQHQQNFMSQQQQQTPNISMVSQLNQNIPMNQQSQIQMQHASQASHIIQQQNQSLTQSQQAQQQIQNISQMLSQSTPLSQSSQLNQHGQNMKSGLLINQHSQSVSLSNQIQGNISNQAVQSITQQIIQTSQAMAQQAAQNQNLNQQQMSQLNPQQLLNNTLQSLTSQQNQSNITQQQQQQTQQMGMSPQNQNMGLVSQQSVTPQNSQVQSIQLNQLMNASQQNQLHQLQNNQQNLSVQGQQGVNVSLQPNWRQQNIQMVQNTSPAQHQLIRSPMMQQRAQQSQMILQQQLQLQNQQQVMLNNQQQLQQSPQNPMQQQSPQQILQQSINAQQTQGITHSQSHHQILVQKQQMVGPSGQQPVLINQHGGQPHQQILVPGSQHVTLQGAQQLVSQSQIIQQGGKQIITQAGQQIIAQGNQQVLSGNQHVIAQGSQHQVMISQPTQQIVTQSGQQIVNQNQQGPNQQGQQVIQQQVGQQHQVLGQQNSGVQQIIAHQGGQQIVAQGGQQIVQGGQQIVQGGQQIVQGGPQIVQSSPQIVQGGQQIVQGGQQLVQGNQQIVQGGQQLVAGQQIVGSNQQIVGSGQQLVQGGQQIIQGGQPIVQGQQQPGQNIMWQQQQQYIQRQQQIITGQPGTVGQRVSWAAGAGGRQLIHLDAQTHAQLQQMDPQQRALFVAQLQKRRQLSMQRAAALAHQQQQQQQHQPGTAVTPTASTGGTAQSVTFIRGQMPPGLTGQQQVQWLQQQGARASVVAASPTPPSPAPGTAAVGSLDAQYQQLQLQRQQQYQRLQQLQAQREHVAAHHKPHQPTVQGLNNRPPNAIALPDGTAEASVVTPVIATEQPGVVGGAAAAGGALVVNPKTKTALANMLSIRLQGAGAGPTPPGASPEVAEPSAAGTLRLMTAAHNAPPRTPAPRLLVGGAPPALVLPHSPQHPAPQHQVGTKMTFPVGATPAVAGTTPARPPPPPRAQFYGHNPNLKLPPDLFLLGCVFHIVEYQQSWGAERVARWAEAVGRRGGEVESAYCARVTHVLCETQRHGVVMQALRDGKRCVTAYWLSDAMVRRAVSPPWQALHLPALYAARDRPARAHRASLSGWRADERHRVRFMIEHVGAKLTSYLTRDNTVLVCKRAEGAKYRRAREWGLPCVSTLWLTDLLLGNMSALSQIENAKYQQFNLASPFRMEYTLVPHLMNPWKMPINITQESHERVKRGALATPRRAKRPRLEPPPAELDAPAVPPPPEHLAPRVLFSNVAELARLSAIVKQLGGRIVTTARDATHLVMDKLVRTPKLITCLVTVKHLLSPEWLLEGRKLNKFADEAKFALRDEGFNQMFKCDVSEVLLSGEQRKKLFEGITFYLTPCVQPSRVILTEMIELCGGKVDKNRKSFVSIQEVHKEKPYSYLVVTTPNDLHLVYYLLQSEKSINVVCNTELILSAILRQRLDVEEFLVKFD